MKVFGAILLLAFCVQAAISDYDESDDWISWAGKFEGDIALTEHQERQILNSSLVLNGTERNGIRDMRRRWGDKKIPYTFGATFNSQERRIIDAAIADYSANTCIRIVPRTNENDYVEFIKDGGCYSYWGRTGGKQPISLGGGCVQKGIVIHEIMHAAGFLHEQSRPDRDTYIRINTQNILNGFQSQFNKYPDSLVQVFGQPYDYKSVMHYSEYAFSRDRRAGLKTIVAHDGTTPLGQRNGFTQIDINKLNALYECQSGETDASTAATAATEPPTASSTESPACGDALGSDNCARWSRLCNNWNFSNFMQAACAQTCNFCGPTACFDKHPRICGGWARRGICTLDRYRSWMEDQCAASCNAC